MTLIERQTYSILDWLGDIGGLREALIVIGRNFVAPIAAFAMQGKLFYSFYRKNKKQDVGSNTTCCNFLNKRHRRLRKSREQVVTKQLDLLKLIQRQRILLMAFLVTLDTR